MLNYNTDSLTSQVNNYAEKKKKSLKLQDVLMKSLSTLGRTNDLNHVNGCGSYLIFRQSVSDAEAVKLDKIYLCKHKYCVFCQAIKSSKKLKVLKEVFSLIETDRYKYKFITLTAPSVSVKHLRAQVNAMQSAFNALNANYKKSALLRGYYKSLELTYNEKTKEFHPHLHIVADAEYIDQKKLCEDWTRLCDYHAIRRSNYDGDFVCDIRLAFKPHELCKYVVKPDTISEDAMMQLLSSNALKGMRDNSASGTIRLRMKKVEELLERISEEKKVKIDKNEFNEIVLLWNGCDYNIKK